MTKNGHTKRGLRGKYHVLRGGYVESEEREWIKFRDIVKESTNEVCGVKVVWVGRGAEEQTGGWAEEQTCGWAEEQTCGWAEEQTGGWAEKQACGWAEEGEEWE